MKPLVWIEGNLADSAQQRLSTTADIIRSSNIDDIAGSDGVVLGSRLYADGELMDRAGKKLCIIARIGIGVDNVDLQAASDRGVLVVNTPDAPTESTAEHTVALVMSLAKRVVRGHLSLTGGSIPRRELFGTELRGRVLGVVGYGRIGRRVAEICSAGLGMETLIYDPYLSASAVAPPHRRVEEMDELLRRSDVVTLHLALSEETRHIIAARELRLMKPGAYLVNASRGQVVDEGALVSALAEKRIAGAAVDVFEREPPQSDNPLLALENVVVTPHIASFTDAGVEAMGAAVVEQLESVFRGERPRFLVNPDVWPGRADNARTTRETNERQQS